MSSKSPVILPVLENVPGIRAFFTTRSGVVSESTFSELNLGYFSGDDPNKVKQNWDRVLESTNLQDKTLTLPRLCHGNRIEEVFAGTSSSLENTDAVFTRLKSQVLAVTLGDCLAALIADPETRCIAAVHAGWRGSRDNILGKTLKHLYAAGRCHPESTWIALGPCLSIERLEIPEEIADTLPALHVKRRENRFYFDLRGCNRAQAEAEGSLPERITVMEACTFNNPDLFFSYRRDGAASGRMAACISLV